MGQFKRSGRMVTVCHSSTLDFRLLNLNSPEQSENVYENKGRGQEVENPLTRFATLATLPDFWGPMVRSESDQKSDSPGKRAAADEVWSGRRLLVTLRLSTLDFWT